MLAVCRSWSLGLEEALSSTSIVDITILGTSTGAYLVHIIVSTLQVRVMMLQHATTFVSSNSLL